ncbi:MAG: hypothetical protein ISS72_09030 [Candidatus Brocadiae bacterium]|nr:hypothetical protein [Candidatus Brocadiia bacterium]
MRPRILLGIGLLLGGALAQAGGPARYVKKATWHESLLASRQALATASAGKALRIPLPDLGKTPFTIMAWVRTRRGGTILAKAPARGKWAAQGKTFFIRGGQLSFDIGWVGAVTGRRNVADGHWHHVAATRGRDLRFYVDGTLDQTGHLQFEADPRAFVAKIGYTSDNFPAPSGYQGALDEVWLYARELSADEIAAHAKERQPAKAEALVGYWPFDGGGADASGSGNHAAGVARAKTVAGKHGQAVELDGRSTLRLPSAGSSAADDLWALVERDFPDPAARKEMAWEREDHIWPPKPDADSAATLARRYAAATQRPNALARDAKALAAKATTPADLARVRALYLASRRYGEALEHIAAFDLQGLRATIGDLYDDAPARDRLLARLDAVEAQAVQWAGGEIPAGDFEAWKKSLAALRHDALVTGNPLFDFDEIVFVKRFTYSANHYYTEFINSRWTPGGNLCVLDLKTGQVRELCPSLEGGVFERFDVSFDAKRIVFAWKGAHQEGYRIYEVNVDGTGLRQITFPQDNEKWLVKHYRARPHYHHGTDDMHPCYLADGHIAFISTRCQYGILCDAPDDFTTTTLYRMDPQGKHMQRLSKSSVSEASPVLMPDGRILYTRWEYFDKGAVSVKCLWAMYPDGTMSSEIYANDISLPPTFLYGRPIPDVPNHYVVLGTPHCPQNGVGTVIRLNMSGGSIRTREPMTYMTPDVDIQAEPGFAFRDDDDRWRQDRGGKGRLFKDPYPLSKKYFLVAHKPAGNEWNDPKGYGLYLLDETGRVSLIYRDRETSCWLPFPLRPRKTPPVLRTARDPALAQKGLARCIVADVYHGLAGVERGTVKYIRIIEQMPRPWAARRRWGGDGYDQQHVTITKDTHLGLKVQHGVVPVEDDGSAHFLVPAGGNISFQALDENYMALQTERTFVNYMPGESRACIGCHETPDNAPSLYPSGALKALARPPSVPGPQLGETAGPRPLHYITDVQPVFDKHCVKCHSGKEPKGKLDLSGQLTALFCVSYESLVPERRRNPRRDRGLLGPVIGENHPKTGNVHYLPAKSLGSHASVLVAMLGKGTVQLRDPKAAERAAKLARQHKDIHLARAELLRITNWVDTNSQYYGSWWGRRNLRYKSHPNFRPVPTFQAAIRMTSPIAEDQR